MTSEVNGPAPDVVERVESASLHDLRTIDIDDVYEQMDWLLQSRPTPLDLYHRWENQNWNTQDIDFSEDAQQWQMLGILREMQMLPGFYSGFTAVARDESRHVNFGVRALMEAGIHDRSHLERVEKVIHDLLEPACRTVAAPDRKFAFTPEESPENLRINPYEVRSFSLNSLTKRLRVAGLSQASCDEITRLGLGYYDKSWAEYEDTHGVEHPRRFYDRQMAGAAS